MRKESLLNSLWNTIGECIGWLNENKRRMFETFRRDPLSSPEILREQTSRGKQSYPSAFITKFFVFFLFFFFVVETLQRSCRSQSPSKVRMCFDRARARGGFFKMTGTLCKTVNVLRFHCE